MRRFLLALTLSGLAWLPAMAQTTPPAGDSESPSKPAPASKPAGKEAKNGKEAKHGEMAAPPAKKKTARAKVDIVQFNGTLSAADPSDKVRAGCYHRVHPFKMSPDKSYVIEMSQRSQPIDCYLRLEDSSGKQLAQDDDSAGHLNARIIFTPTSADTYRIIATTCSPHQAGDYLLTIQPVAPGTVISRPGEPVTSLVPAEIGDLTITPLPLMTSDMGGSSDGSRHGYVEYSFLIENRSAARAHQVTLTIPRFRAGYQWGHHLQALQKTVEVGPGGSVTASLFQPFLQLSSNNGVEVRIDGRVAESGAPINLLSQRGAAQGGPFSVRPPPTGRVGPTVHLLTTPDLIGPLQTHIYKSAVGVPVDPAAVAGPGQRTGVYFEKGSPHHGQKYIYSPIHQFVSTVAAYAEWSKHWMAYGSHDGVIVSSPALQAAPPEVRNALWQYTECGGTLLILGAAKVPESWPAAPLGRRFTSYRPGFGRCLVTEIDDVTNWTPEEWRDIASMWESSGKAWDQVTSPSEAHRQFPVVEDLGIPVRGLFLFMFVFVVLIGPVNIYWLTRIDRKLWLLWTVPAFSLATSGVLFLYMALTEGWRGHMRAHALTVLDENAQRAATVGWMGFYSPTTPGGGLRFSLDTELSPHFNPDHTFGRRYNERFPATIDWTDDQHLDSGWIVAKVPVHFLVRRNEKRLERLIVRRNAGSVRVVNGLKADVASLWLADQDGKVWRASDLRAGAEATLQPTDATVTEKATLESAPPKAMALRLDQVFADSWLAGVRKMEQTPDRYLRPGTYLAIVEELPFLEAGLRSIQSRNVRSLVYGVMKSEP